MTDIIISPTFFLLLSVVLAFVATSLMLRYLQGGRLRSAREAQMLEALNLRLEEGQIVSSQLQDRLLRLEKQWKEQRAVVLSEPERTQLLERLRTGIEESAKDEVLDRLRVSIKDEQAHVEEVRSRRKWEGELVDRQARTVERLSRELGDLARRGNLNLAIGVITASIGVAFLAQYLIGGSAGESENTTDFMRAFLPRISLVVFIQIFAYYFLRLYSNSLIEIKYFQNEITNVEAQFLALRVAINDKSQQSVEEVVRRLAHTERNFVLQKGQSTVGLERGRIGNETIESSIRDATKK